MKIYVDMMSTSRMWDRQDPEVAEALARSSLNLDSNGQFWSDNDSDDARVDLFLDLLKSVKFQRIRPQGVGPDDYYFVKALTVVRVGLNANGHRVIYSIT